MDEQDYEEYSDEEQMDPAAMQAMEEARIAVVRFATMLIFI